MIWIHIDLTSARIVYNWNPRMYKIAIQISYKS
jgi:hypothetical protein